MTPWKPASTKQLAFCLSPAFELLYGGAAGGGKSDAVLAEGSRQVQNPNYRGIIFRRTFPQLERLGGLIDRSKQLFPQTGGAYSEFRHRWTWPSGAMVDFGHLQREADKTGYQGSQYGYIGFDELTHFTETQYLYMFARCRAPEEYRVTTYIRNATNPGGIGHAWVKRRWGAWLDKNHPNPALPGELRYYARVDEVDTEVAADFPDARSRTFIPAFVWDNPYLAGTDYEANLRALQRVERLRLLYGDWDVMPGAGMVFQRQWFDIVRAAPKEVARKVRYWDLAASEAQVAGDDPDFTVGVRMSLTTQGVYFVEHVVRRRLRWGGIKQLLRQTAQADGPETKVYIEQEPGAGGKNQVAELVAHLAGFAVRGNPARGDKVVRANPFSAQAEVRNVKLVNGPWVEYYLDELEAFPEGSHDDQVDASSGAFGMLAKPSRVLLGTL